MSVYVDPMMNCVRSKQWPWYEACHMWADSDQELHAFAAQLGLKRSWFQVSRRGFRHYDLTEGKRKKAVEMGAIETEWTKELLQAVREQHRKQTAGDEDGLFQQQE